MIPNVYRIALVVCAFFLAAQVTYSQEPTKIAFVVGVSEYQKDGLTNLKFAHKDANDLATELDAQGFTVTKLIGKEAKHAIVRSKLKQFVDAAEDLGKNDVVLLSFSGHGVQKLVKKDRQMVETPFICVYDSMVTKPNTMISLNQVLAQVKENSGCSNNLLIVDACRNNPDKGARTLDGSTVKELPTKISMLFSSSPGQKSYESDKVKQGVFTHVLLKGLRGEAANSRGQVKWASLATYVLEELPLHTSELLEDSSIQQIPNLVGNFVGSPILVQPRKPLSFVFNKKNSSLSWEAELGSPTYTRPATARGKVFIGTNNGAGHRNGIDAKQDKGVLLCFDDSNGKFLWQLTRDKLESGRVNDWPYQGIVSQPCVEGDRLWVITNRGEVMCLDTEGFHDGENDGSVKSEKLKSKQDADIIWSLNMIEELGVFSHLKFVGDPVIFEDILFVNTSNGVDEKRLQVPSPRAPTFLAINKNTGEVIWTANQPFDRIMEGSWASPAIGVVKGVPQVVFPGGDGWLYAFHARSGKLLWKFDLNPKEYVWERYGGGTRNHTMAKPVFYEDSVILASGQNPEQDEGVAHLWRIDATKRGDISAELGEIEKEGRPNPNSGVIWHFGGGSKGDDIMDDDYIFRRTMSSPAITPDSLLFITDLSGFMHCLDVKTGKRHWEYDLLSGIWASPVFYRDHILIGDEDGRLGMFEASHQFKEPTYFDTKNYSTIYATVHIDGDSIYVTSRNRLTKFDFPQK